MGRGRPGGNPDFGTKYKFDYGNTEKKNIVLSFRITESMLEKLKEVAGDDYKNFCLDAIAQAVEQQSA